MSEPKQVNYETLKWFKIAVVKDGYWVLDDAFKEKFMERLKNGVTPTVLIKLSKKLIKLMSKDKRFRKYNNKRKIPELAACYWGLEKHFEDIDVPKPLNFFDIIYTAIYLDEKERVCIQQVE